MPGTRPQPQPGKRGNKTHPTPTSRPPISHTQPKLAWPTGKCNLRASIGTCTPHRQTNRILQGQPGSHADPAMQHPAHHRSQGKDTSPASRRRHRRATSHTAKRLHSPRDAELLTSMPAKQKQQSQAKPQIPPQANATATPHILPYIGRGTVKTTNPKPTSLTRNHPADKQTPSQFKAEKPDATTEPSNARPAAHTCGDQSRRTQDHRPNTTALHTVECSKEHPKQKQCTKPTLCKCTSTNPPNTNPPGKGHPHEEKTHSIQVQEHARHPYLCQK
ncbi:hypothetical protein GOODEAATRI_026943 [Goodea atripinnis]|uniref:Uncharacterized protein n=1 Tax=Goodea atripinnis TaxID=208336 RepID=A0ABV0ML10_9TELE